MGGGGAGKLGKRAALSSCPYPTRYLVQEGAVCGKQNGLPGGSTALI